MAEERDLPRYNMWLWKPQLFDPNKMIDSGPSAEAKDSKGAATGQTPPNAAIPQLPTGPPQGPPTETPGRRMPRQRAGQANLLLGRGACNRGVPSPAGRGPFCLLPPRHCHPLPLTASATAGTTTGEPPVV
jgi:hypothetical protein